MGLVPGLPDEMARECLNRIPFVSFPKLISVCKAWSQEIRNPDFHRFRRHTGQARPVFILADVSPYHRKNKTSKDNSPTAPKLFFQLTIFDPSVESGSFIDLPPSPSLPEEFSGFNITGIVALGTNVIITLFVTKREGVDFMNLVYVFDVLTRQWRRGADLPGPGRCVLRLDVDPSSRKVLVAGGYSHGGLRLASAFLYNVETNEWSRVLDMEKERYECSVVFHGDRFHVISGRSTSEERPFNRMTCAESLDPITLQWGPINNEFLEPLASDYHWVMGNGKGDIYQIGKNIRFRRDREREWRPLAKLPDDLQQHVTCAMTWRDKMVVIGRRPKAYVLDLQTRKWDPHDLPYDSLYVGCGMDL